MNVFVRALLLPLAMASASAIAVERPVIMLTGFWAPTNEMLRRFSTNPEQNREGWLGANWEGRGYDIHAFFPEFPRGSGKAGVGDFRVKKKAVRADFERIVPSLRPISLVSFGRQVGKDWVIETKATDYWMGRSTISGTLPVEAIARAVSEHTVLKAEVDSKGDAGSFICGLLFRLGADYQRAHSSPSDPARMISQGFIHLSAGKRPEVYLEALFSTLRAVIFDLDQKLYHSP